MFCPVDSREPDSQRICRIIRINFFRDPHHPHDHLYDLSLFSPAVTHDLLLDLQRSTLKKRHFFQILPEG